MVPVNFKKWQCPLSLFLKFSCLFENSQMSPVEFRKSHVALSNLKVKGPSEDGQIGPPGVGPVTGGSQHVVLGLL